MTLPQKEKSKNKPKRGYRRWVFPAMLTIIAIGFCLTTIFGERILNKLNRIRHHVALGLNMRDQQLAAMRSGDIVLVTFNALATDYTIENLTTDIDGYARFPEWSPDGEWIAFDLGEWRDNGEANRSIYIMRADGSDKRKLINGVSPQWHPHQDIIYFTDWGNSRVIKAIDIQSGDVTDVVSVENCPFATESLLANFRLHPNELLAVFQLGHRTALWSKATNTCSLLDTTYNPVWMEDGTIVAGYSGRLPINPPLIHQNMIDTRIQTETFHIRQINGSSPSASPHGRYVAYDATTAVNILGDTSNWTIYLYDTETGRYITLVDRMAHPSWRSVAKPT